MVVSQSSDMWRHMKLHDPYAKFVLLFSNSLFVIDTYFLGNFHVVSQAAITYPYRGPTRRPTFADSVYLFIFFPPPHYESLMHLFFSYKIITEFCPNCIYGTWDPALLTRHRKKHHGYITKRCKSSLSSLSPASTCTMPSSSSPFIYYSSNSPPIHMSDTDLFIHFCADMEQLDALEAQQIPLNQFM